MAFRNLLLACSVLVAALSPAWAECANAVFADDANEVKVFFHSGKQETTYTEVKNGVGKICNASWSDGFGSFKAHCPDRPQTFWEITPIVENDTVIAMQYGSLRLHYQCACDIRTGWCLDTPSAGPDSAQANATAKAGATEPAGGQ